MEPTEIKRRGPRKARNRLQEMTISARAFVKALDGHLSTAADKFAIEQSTDLQNLLIGMEYAIEAAKSVHKAFEPSYAALRREAELVTTNARLEAQLREMAEALRTSGHSDKIPEAFRSAPPRQKRAGRPPKVNTNEMHAA